MIRDLGLPDEIFPDAEQTPLDRPPDEVIVFLLGSRYVETQELDDLAWKLFGDIELDGARAQAIVAYAHQRITSATSTPARPRPQPRRMRATRRLPGL